MIPETHYMDSLPEGWVLSTIQEVGQIVCEGVDPRHVPSEMHLAPDNIESSTGKLFECHTVEEDKVVSNNFRFKTGDVLYTKLRPYLNKVVVAPFDGVCSSDILPIRPHIVTRYLAYWMLSPRFIHQVIPKQTGVTLPRISRKELNGLSIPLAPLAEQRRIVEAIEANFARLERTMETLEAVRCRLNNARAGILQAACSGTILPQGEGHAQSLKRELRNWRDEELFGARAVAGRRGMRRAKAVPSPPVLNVGIAKGWEPATIDEVAVVDVGFAFRSVDFVDQGIRLLRGENIEPGGLRWEDTRFWPLTDIADFDHLIVKEGDVILAMDRPIVSAGIKVAEARAVDSPCLLVQRVARIRSRDRSLQRMIYYNLQLPSAVAHLVGDQTGTQLPHITAEGIATLSFGLPPLDEQDRIVSEAERLLGLLQETRAGVSNALARTHHLRRSILGAAFSGHLVPQDPNDEPASVLLERIKHEREMAPVLSGRRAKGARASA